MQRRNWVAGLAGLTITATAVASARAETPLERGTYLMRSIVACGNCHTPKGPQGELPGMELAGNVTIEDDAFTAVTSNITPDPQTGIGKYLAGPLGHCVECHSTPDAHGVPDVVNQTGGGGMQFRGPWGISHAPNITPAALAKYSDDDIKNAITKGMRPDGSRLMPPMAYGYYKNISAPDLDAIVGYLRTLKPL
jgi:mono/diheme cytochrome c family protein